jgi:hypothetical protein
MTNQSGGGRAGSAAKALTSAGGVAGASGVYARAATSRAVSDSAARTLREEVRIKNAINALNIREIKKEERARLSMVKAEGRAREKIARDELQHLRQRSRFMQSTLGHGLTRVGGTVKAVGKTGAAMVGVGGAALVAGAVSGVMKLDERVRRLLVSSRQAGTASKYDPDQLRKQFEQTGISTGIDADSLAGAAQAFVSKTGDIDTAVKNMETFATVAQATGASVEDVASAAADLSEKMDIKSVEDMKKALTMLTFQGKAGAFEIRDMASQFPKLAAAAKSFGIKGLGGIAKLGGFLQLARGATGSAEQASFATEATFRQLTAKSAQIQSGEAFGGRRVEVFEGGDPTKPVRDFTEVIGDVMQASRGNLVELQKTFDTEGIRALRPLISTFRGASDAAGGGEKGAKAGRDAVMKAMNDAGNATSDWKEIQKDAGDVMKSSTVKLEVVYAQLKEAIGKELVPEIQKLIPELGKLVPHVAGAAKAFVDIVKFLSEHPFLSLGALMSAQILADIGKAKLGSVIGNAITRSMPTQGGSGGSGQSSSNPVAGVLSIAATSVAVTAAGVAVIDSIFGGKDTADKSVRGAAIEASNTASAVRAGKPGSAEEAGKRMGELHELIAKGEGAKAGREADPTGGVINFMGGAFDALLNFASAGGAGKSWSSQQTSEAAANNLESLKTEAAELLKALKEAAQMQKDAGALQQTAAKDSSAAAKELGASKPAVNRSNSPSPVKS